MKPINLPLESKRWLSPEEAAAWTGTDVDWILNHIKSGALKCVVTAERKSAGSRGPQRRRIDRIDLDALMERLKGEAIPAGVVAEGKSKARVSGRPSVRERLAKLD